VVSLVYLFIIRGLGALDKGACASSPTVTLNNFKYGNKKSPYEGGWFSQNV